jgi:hypothetical protein
MNFRAMASLAAIAAVALLSSCTQPSQPPTAQATAPPAQAMPQPSSNRVLVDKTLVSKLLEVCGKLGQTELARIQAAEEQYKTAAAFFQNQWHPLYPTEGVFAKLYRNYTGVETVDIKRSDSLLYPVKMVLRFDYENHVTTLRHSSSYPDAKEASKDTEFKLHSKESLVREYICDETGALVGDVPDLPLRHNYFQLPGELGYLDRQRGLISTSSPDGPPRAK